jgi:inositol hexakisphosphate/diphosphoinositol-pentakisphosphate kinase
MFKALMANIGWKKSKKSVKKITLGICAMDKKAKSKPMREILQRLPEELFTIVYFGDECILNQPVESWPVVEVLISFFSKGFPTQKALEYVKLRKPYMINDLEMEATLSDRRKVYNLLKSQNIDVPRHLFVSRDDPDNENILEEFDEVNRIQHYI